MADLLGYSVDELLSMKATDLNPRQSQRGWRTLFERVGEIGVATNEFLFIRKDGSPIAVEVIDNYLKFGDAEYIFSSVGDISERKSTEDALRMTQFAVDTAHDGIFWVDRDGRFAYANEAAADMLGYSREQLLKLRIPDTSPWRTIAAWRTQFDELRRIGVRTDEFPLRRRDGSSVAVEITDNHFKFGEHEFVFSYVRDITERKRTESALRLTQFAVHNASDGIFWTGRDGTFAYANEAAARLLGYGSGAELTGLNVTDINPDQTPQSWLSLFEEIKRGNALTSEQHFVTKDGRRIPVEVTDNYFVYEDREHVFAYFRDITERKQTDVVVDSIQIEQVLLNLMRNGIEAMNDDWSGQGLLTVRTALLESGYVRVDVRDNGPPAKPDDIDQMFEAFHSTKVDGMGAMSLSLLKFVGQASLVDDAMLPS